MKTRLLLVVGIAVISTIVISYSYGYIPFGEHYKIEITGLKDTYTTDEVYSFDYHITGIGDSCAAITVTYPNGNGEMMTMASTPQCAAERIHYTIISESAHYGPLGNTTIKVPGKYKVSVTYDPLGSILFATTTKEFEIIKGPNFPLIENFGNPNECWYQEDDGSMTPCRMESDPSTVGYDYGVELGYALLIVPPSILGILLVFIVLRKRK